MLPKRRVAGTPGGDVAGTWRGPLFFRVVCLGDPKLRKASPRMGARGGDVAGNVAGTWRGIRGSNMNLGDT